MRLIVAGEVNARTIQFQGHPDRACALARLNPVLPKPYRELTPPA